MVCGKRVRVGKYNTVGYHRINGERCPGTGSAGKEIKQEWRS